MTPERRIKKQVRLADGGGFQSERRWVLFRVLYLRVLSVHFSFIVQHLSSRIFLLNLLKGGKSEIARIQRRTKQAPRPPWRLCSRCLNRWIVLSVFMQDPG